MNTAFKKMTRAIAWLATASLTLGFAMMPTGAVAATVYKWGWVAQSGTVSPDGYATQYTGLHAGDSVNLSLTLQNLSGTTIQPKSALPVGTLQVPVGSFGIGTRRPQDGTPTFLDPSSFILNNNRFVYYDGPAVAPNANFTLNWTVKLASTVANGTYDMYVGPVWEFKAWARQISHGVTLGMNQSDVFWRFVVGSGVSTAPTGGLSVALSYGTPAAGSIAKAGNANFTKITLTAAPGATVSVSSIYVTRGGLTADTDIENIKMLTADGVQVGNTAGGFDANHRAQVFFTPQLAITGTAEYYIRAGFVSTATTGLTAMLGIAANSDIVCNATSVTGAPVWGNPMTAVAVTIGTIDVSEDGSVSDTTPDVGDTNVVLNTFKITAGSTEGINIDRITVLHAGSSAYGDTNNIELWDVTHNVTLGTSATWTADGKASWPVNIALGRGDNIRLKVMADIVNGVTLTINCDIADGSDYLVFGKGQTYGFYITPTAASASNWTVAAGGSNNLGQGDYNQTINTGTLTISKSSTTPATGYIAVADNQLLAVWDWQVQGEQTRVSSVIVRGNLNDAGAQDYTDMTNARLVDMATGNVLAGPVDGADGGGTYGTTAVDPKFTFSNTFVLPVGITRIGFKVRLSTDWVDADTIIVTLYQAADVTAKGIISNNTVSATGLAAAGNTQTVKAGAMTLRTLGTPPTGSVVRGATDFNWGDFALDATAGGEDAMVTSLTFTDTLDGTSADMANIDALVLYADLNGDGVFGSDEAVTIPEYPTGGGGGSDTHTFSSLTKTITVLKGHSMKLRLVGNLATGATALGTHAITLTSGTITGASTGSDIGEGTSGTAGVLTVQTGGSVTTALAASNPISSLIVASSTSYATLGAFDFIAATEAYTIDTVTFDLTNGFDSLDKVKITYPIKGGGTESRETLVSAAAVAFSNIAMYVPKNDRATLTVTATTKTVGTSGTGGTFDDSIILVLDTSSNSEFNATGEASGAAKTGGDVSDQTANTMYLFDTVPTVVASNPSTAGTIVPGGVINLYKFKVTADAAHAMAIKSFHYSIFITDASTTTASAADLTNFTILRDGVDITSSAQITEVSSDGSSFIATPLTLEATNYLENNTSYWVQVAFGNDPTGDTEQDIDKGQTVEYTLRAQAGTGFTTTDAISTGLLQDTTVVTGPTYAYLNDEDTGTGVQQVVALQTSGGATFWTATGLHFIWSDKSTVAHAAGFDDDGTTYTSSPDWANGYLVKNYPLSSYGYTL